MFRENYSLEYLDIGEYHRGHLLYFLKVILCLPFFEYFIFIFEIIHLYKQEIKKSYPKLKHRLSVSIGSKEKTIYNN